MLRPKDVHHLRLKRIKRSLGLGLTGLAHPEVQIKPASQCCANHRSSVRPREEEPVATRESILALVVGSSALGMAKLNCWSKSRGAAVLSELGHGN